MSHPFLENTFHTLWHRLRPETIEADIDLALTQAQARIDTIASTDPAQVTVHNSILALEKATEDLGRAWGYVGHLDSVCNSPELRTVYNAMLPKVSEFFTRIPLNDALWKVIKAFGETEEAAVLKGTYARLLEETLADFRESGADLPAEQKARLEALNAELSQVTQKFSENVLDATNAWELLIEDESRLTGLPDSIKAAAREDAQRKGHGSDEKTVWRFTQHAPSMMPVMQYAEDESLRKAVWEGASQLGRREPYDNRDLIRQILMLRQEKAVLLGKQNFGDLILQRRMAKDSATALAFTQDLHDRIENAFAQEVSELEAFKAEQTGGSPEHLEPWESAYWSEKLRRARYDLDEEQLRPYFPIDKVLTGMFRLVETIFAVSIVQRPTVYINPETKQETHSNEPQTQAPFRPLVEVWHPDVKYYDLLDEDGSHLGSFYADWYPRESKRGGAWMNYLRTGGISSEGPNEPHLGLMCGNLNPPVGGKPALLTHRDVETIFHEFGHLLHHLLGKVEVKSLNGVNVAWDFVELPSQIMENWCWEREALDLFARHHETNEPIPEELFTKMLAARNFQSASATMKQLAQGKLDLDLHASYIKDGAPDLDAFIDQSLE
ncbi:MAG: M3 family metallopeptidase, partial [Verrucomicrobiota bacterium]